MVVIVVDAAQEAHQMEMALARSGAAVFVASKDEDCGAILAKVTPHFAVIDPTVSGGSGPQSLAWMLFSHPECRTIVYSSNVHLRAGVEPRWLIGKDRPVSDVVETILAAVHDPVWISKGGDDVKPMS